MDLNSRAPALLAEAGVDSPHLAIGEVQAIVSVLDRLVDLEHRCLSYCVIYYIYKYII